jgi:glycosyltransferase involved in cell wall biosynthesis
MTKVLLLTVEIITMNRTEQLTDALNSCAQSVLPENTQFVVVDNASTDDTLGVVIKFKNCHPKFEVKYELQNSNLGFGGGRSRAFDLSVG